MTLAKQMKSWFQRLRRRRNSDGSRCSAPQPNTSRDALLKDVVEIVTASKWFMVDQMERFAATPDHHQCPICNRVANWGTFAEHESYCKFGGGRLVRHQCPDCGVIFGPQKMFQLSEAELAEEYRWLYRFYSEANSVDNEVRTFYHLAPRRDGVYLNFGSGGAWSSSVAKLRGEGWNIYGFEPFAASACDHVIRDWDQLRSMRFDGIISNNVLEHLTDPQATFRLWRDLLKGPQSTMAHSTPCFEYRYPFTRFHLFFYTGRSLQLIADQAGFTSVKAQQDGEYICYRFDKTAAAARSRAA